MLHRQDVSCAQDIDYNTGDIYNKVEIQFNSLMTEIFEASKIQVEKPRMPESKFTSNQFMHLHINFHKLALTQGSS